MKHLFVLSLLCMQFLLASAQKDSVAMNPAKRTYQVLKNQEITIMETNEGRDIFPEMIKGKKLVFQYQYKAAENPMMTDDELFESIMFQVEPFTKSFTLKGDALLKSNATFNRSCFCRDRGYFLVTGGYIKGKKINSTTYAIEFNLTFKSPEYRGGQVVQKRLKAHFRIASN